MPIRFGFLLNFFFGDIGYGGRQENMFTKETKSMANRYGFLLILFFEILDMAHGEKTRKHISTKETKIMPNRYGFDFIYLFLSFFLFEILG